MKRESINIKFLGSQVALSILSLLLLSGCAGYSNKFACGSSKGADCVMISEIDKMVDSGEIEEFQKRNKCKGKFCMSAANKPRLKNHETHRALVIKPEEAGNYKNGEYLYIK